jgi:PAS domain S-box-containing protein
MNLTELTFDALSLEESPDAVVVMTQEGGVLHWNKGAEAVFGYSAAESVGRPIDELIVPPDRDDEHERQLAETLANGFATFESLRRRKDGTLVYVDVSWKVVRLAGHDAPLILSTKKDVTALRVLRDTKQVEARYRNLLESTPDGIVMVNPTGHIVFTNSHAQKLFGYDRGELHGKPIEMLLPQRFRAAHFGHRARYFEEPRTRAMGAGLELFGLRKDSTEFPVEISLSPMQMDETILVMSAIRDISDRKRIEQELREKNVQLEEASRAKDRFLASMSHELRTPLNAIIGFTGTLLMKLPGPLTPDQDKQLRTVQMSAKHLLSLINDLLDIAKIQAGKVELGREPIDCRRVVQEIVATLRPEAERKGLAFTATLPDDMVSVHTDQRALSQIVINLTQNAIKFTDRGGVHVSVSRRDTAAEKVVAISVEDTGLGIRPQDQAKLFEAFSRVQGHRRDLEGTGLGLHLSRQLAELMGARITLQSEYGKGSTFTLELTEA